MPKCVALSLVSLRCRCDDVRWKRSAYRNRTCQGFLVKSRAARYASEFAHDKQPAAAVRTQKTKVASRVCLRKWRTSPTLTRRSSRKTSTISRAMLCVYTNVCDYNQTIVGHVNILSRNKHSTGGDGHKRTPLNAK